MIKKLFFTATLIPLGFFLSGCQTSVNTIERAEPTSSPSYVEDQRIITDSTLAKGLNVISLNQGYVSTDLLQVQATIENTKLKPKTFFYAFEWITEEGMVYGSAVWKVITLQGGERTAISAIATSPRVTDFRLKLQERK